jgi:hypothetical protein
MSTSGTYTWTATRDFIIQEAFRKIGRLGDYEPTPITDGRLTVGINALNALVKSLHNEGMPLWAITEQTIPMSNWFNISTTGVSIGPGATINQILKPLKILQALRIDTSSTPSLSVPLNIYTYEDYERLSMKASQGAPVHIFYQPQEFIGNIWLWLSPDSYWNVNGQLYIRYQRMFQDFNAATDQPDFPVEWHEALIYLLAVRIAPVYGVPLPDRQMLTKEAEGLKQKALEFGTEEGSLYLHPQWRWQ